MGKSTISMAIFNSFLYVYQRVYHFKLRKSTELLETLKGTGDIVNTTMERSTIFHG